MNTLKNLLVLYGALIPIWIVVGQDFTPSVFDRNDGSIPLNPNDPLSYLSRDISNSVDLVSDYYASVDIS